jgi:hypothetical protein
VLQPTGAESQARARAASAASQPEARCGDRNCAREGPQGKAAEGRQRPASSEPARATRPN